MNATANILSTLGLPASIGFMFDCLEIAEEELKRAKLPKALDSAVHKYAAPPLTLRGKSLDLYRAHVCEFIERARSHGAEADFELVTDAEILATLSDTSLQAPLTQSGTAVTEYLCRKLLPEIAAKSFGTVRTKQQWKGHTKEMLAKLRAKRVAR